MKTRKLLYILPLAALVACEPEFEDVDFNGGNADFTRTVAVGNSLFAGFQSNALSLEGQENSLPNMIAGQLREVGGGEFKQPLLTGDAAMKGAGVNKLAYANGFLLPALSLTTTTDCLGETSLGPSFIPKGNNILGFPNALYPIGEFNTNISAQGPFNNVGVPGARIGNIQQVGYGSAQGNPYFARFAANPMETMIEAAVKQNPTFFELWIGNNDVLGYATSGGDEGGDAITSLGTFKTLYNQVLDSLAKNGAKGVVANIPDVTAIPYFTTVKWNALELSSAQASALGALTTQYNTLVQLNVLGGAITQADADKRKISFEAGANGFLTYDASLMQLRDTSGNAIPGYNFRQLKEGELVILTTPGDSIKCSGFGSVDLRGGTPVPNPLTEDYVLDADEVASIRTAVTGFNSAIQIEARNRGLAFVDVNTTLNKLAINGITQSGINFNSTLVTGGAFSLDGVHPNTRGYAILANEFIDAINSTYSANIRKVDVASYPVLEVGQ